MKRMATAFLAVLLLGSLCACGQKTALPEVALSELGQALAECGAFSDVMSQPAEGVAPRLYGFEDGDAEEYVLYTGTGATAEEIFLIKAAPGGAAELEYACLQRIEDQKKSFENYVPAEVAKLDGAILETAGDYVFFIVAADTETVRSVMDSYIA